MKKQIRNIIIAIIVIILLSVGFLVMTKIVFPKLDEDTTSTTQTTEVSTTSPTYEYEEGIYLTKDESENLSTIEVKNATSEYVLVQPEKKVWYIEGYENLLPNESIGYIVDSMANFRCAEIVEEKCTDFSKYGLDTPEITARAVFRDGSEMTVYFGDKKDDETKSRYLYIENGTTVYVEAVGLSTAYAYPVENLFSNKLLSPISEKVDGKVTFKDFDYIELGGSKRSQVVRIEPNKLFEEKGSGNTVLANSEFVITTPISSALDTSTTGKLSKAYTRITEIGITASSVEKLLPTEEELTEYGFDEPAYKIEMACGDTVYEFIFSDYDSVNKFYYATNGEKDVIYRFTAVDAQWIVADLDKFVPDMMYDTNIINVEKVIVKNNGVTTTFDVTHAGTDFTVATSDGKEISKNAFAVFFSQICKSQWIEVAPTVPTIGGSDTVLDVTIVYNSDLGYPNDRISFTKSGVRRYLLALNSNGYFNCEPSVLDTILATYESMLA